MLKKQLFASRGCIPTNLKIVCATNQELELLDRVITFLKNFNFPFSIFNFQFSIFNRVITFCESFNFPSSPTVQEPAGRAKMVSIIRSDKKPIISAQFQHLYKTILFVKKKCDKNCCLQNIARVRNCHDITILNTLFDPGGREGQGGMGGHWSEWSAWAGWSEC